MFEADQRQSMVELLRPPAGYRLESAFGTTYSLDFVALTAAMLAFVDADEDSGPGPSSHLESLHAIARLGERVRIFVNRGQIQGRGEVNKITALYDRIVHEVQLPEGNFHPKVWLIHYSPKNIPGTSIRPGLLRLICTSRNLTTSRFWEAYVSCDGELVKSKINGSLNAGIRDFILRILKAAPDQPRSIQRLGDELKQATFPMQGQMREGSSFLWQWNGEQGLRRHLPAKGSRALIVSPFVRKSFLKAILARFGKTILISTRNELDSINDPEFIKRLCGAPNQVFVVDSDGGEMDLPLHAKIFVFEDESGSTTLLGSANASTSAWEGQNCEALVRLAPGVPIDHFCDQFVFDGKPTVRGAARPLRGWISEYRWTAHKETENEQIQKRLDDIRHGISHLDIHAQYEPPTRSLLLRLKDCTSGIIEAAQNWELDCIIEIGLWSQTCYGTTRQPFGGILKGGVRLGNVDLADLTEFLDIRISHRVHPEFQIHFILKATMEYPEWREQRDEQLLRNLLSRDNIEDFLRTILFDAAVRPPSPSTPREGEAGNTRTAAGRLLMGIAIEDVLRSCTEDPWRIDEINRLIRGLRNSDLIDGEFRLFWDAFVAADAKARGTARHG